MAVEAVAVAAAAAVVAAVAVVAAAAEAECPAARQIVDTVVIHASAAEAATMVTAAVVVDTAVETEVDRHPIAAEIITVRNPHLMIYKSINYESVLTRAFCLKTWGSSTVVEILMCLLPRIKLALASTPAIAVTSCQNGDFLPLCYR